MKRPPVLAYRVGMERLLHDIRFAVRLLLSERLFTIATVLTLALCLGANATIFAVVHSVLLRPLSVAAPERLVLLYNSYPRAGVERSSNGVPDYFDRLRELTAFDEQALYGTRGLTIGGHGDPQRVRGMAATPSLLRLLGARPVHGRIFTEEEGERGNDRKAILTHGFWQQLYSGEPAAVGRALRINGEPYTIVGILPPGFEFIDPDVRVWTPLSFSAEEKSDDARHSNNWSMVGRLRAGATPAQAQAEVDALNARNLERFPHYREIVTNAGFHTVATPLQGDLVRSVRGSLYLLWGGVLFVLVIGVVNITNLALARSTRRAREFATRQALGAGTLRLARQLMTESILLTLAGGLLGLLLGNWGIDALGGLGLSRLPRGHEVRFDMVATAFTLIIALTAGFIIGAVPMLSMRRLDLSGTFREESRAGTAGRGVRTVRRALVAAQVAIAFVLLIGAGLLLASFQRVLGIAPGFEPAHVLTARVAPPAARYPDETALRSFAGRLLERVRALPGVRHAGLTSNIPFGGDYSDSVILAEGYRMAPGESLISPFEISVTPGYFEAMGIELLRGRTFTDGDTDAVPRVIVIDEKLARRFWGDRNPVGRRMYKWSGIESMHTPGPDARWFTVIGVVSEIRMTGLIETQDRVGAYYFPMAQDPRRFVTLTVKGAGEATAIAEAVRHELAAIDPELPLYGVMTMQERLSGSLVERRTPMLLVALFAALALMLAALGLYGVLAYAVTQRTREIGIRLALGSDAAGIFRLVLAEGLLLVARGLALGLGGAFLMRRAVESQLYGVGSTDPAVYAGVAALLTLVALVACVVPARRASRTAPTVALNA